LVLDLTETFPGAWRAQEISTAAVLATLAEVTRLGVIAGAILSADL